MQRQNIKFILVAQSHSSRPRISAENNDWKCLCAPDPLLQIFLWASFLSKDWRALLSVYLIQTVMRKQVIHLLKIMVFIQMSFLSSSMKKWGKTIRRNRSASRDFWVKSIPLCITSYLVNSTGYNYFTN